MYLSINQEEQLWYLEECGEATNCFYGEQGDLFTIVIFGKVNLKINPK
jgi:hypothetical protein